MSLLDEYLCGAVDLTFLVGDARDKVQWAAIPVQPGELVKEQIYRAHQELRTLPHELVRAAWYGQIGPYQWPYVHNAWLDLAKRRASVFEQFAGERSAWLLCVNDVPVPIRSRSAYSTIRRVTALVREPKRRRA